jgi:hypothetical protein
MTAGALDNQRLGTSSGVRSTTADMVRLVRALLHASAPVIDALTPRWRVG